MIFRTNKKQKGENGKVLHPHTEIDNRSVDDLNLSNGAIGLLVRLLRNKDEWEYTEENLAKKTKTGITELRTQLKELINNNYVERKRYYEKGKFKKYIYTIYEFPEDFDIGDDLPFGTF